jgi:hypothetical protein
MSNTIEPTLENLREGKCILINDGTIDELKAVIAAAFPNANAMRPSGQAKYYYALGDTLNRDWTASFDELSGIYVVKPKFSVKDFININQYNPNIMANNTTTQPKSVPTNRILKPNEAQSIIDAACATWKLKLAKLWSLHIVMDQNISITQEFYKEMRKACTDSQHKLFDEIFGKDVVETIPVEVGDWIVVVKGISTDSIRLDGQCVQVIRLLNNNNMGTYAVGVINGYTAVWNGTSKDQYDNLRPLEYRLATPEEIIKAIWYPHLTPCLVQTDKFRWELLYSAEEPDTFYLNARQKGTVLTFKTHRKLDMNNLVVTD